MGRRVVVHLYGLIMTSILTVPATGHCEASALLTIEQAVELALQQNISLRASEIGVDVARGELVGAERLSRHNPELSGGAALRIGPDALSVDATAALGQTFDLGRPRRHRITAATANVDAALDRVSLQRLRVIAGAEVAFVTCVGAKQLGALAREAESVTGDLLRISRERLSEDAGTELEVNLTALEWAQAKRSLVRSIREQHAAGLELARVLALAPDHDFALPGVMPDVRPVTATVGELTQLALEERLDLSALEGQRDQALAELAVARAEARPELTVEATYDFEEGQDHIVGIGLSLPMPFFQRNQGEIAQARARVALAELGLEDARLTVEREVHAALQRYQAAHEIAEVLGRETIERSADNLALLRASFEEGNVGFVEVLLVQRELVGAQRDAVEAEVALFRARAELELAVGSEVR